MKKSSGTLASKFLLALLLAFAQVIALAQDTTVSTHSETITKSSTTTTDWYMQPWVWVAGGAVFIIILVAMLRGSNSNKEVSRSTTVIKTDKDY